MFKRIFTLNVFIICLSVQADQSERNAQIYLSTNTNLKCDEEKEVKEIKVFSFIEEQFINTKKWALIPESLGCVRPNKYYDIVNLKNEKIGKALVLRTLLLDHYIPYPGVLKTIWPQNYKDAAQFLYQKEFQKKERMISIRFDKSTAQIIKDYKKSTGFNQGLHFVKKILDKKSFDQAIANKWLALDIRTGQEYIKSKIKKSRLLPFSNSPEQRYLDAFKASDLKEILESPFKYRSLSKYKNKPIVVYGSHEYDIRALKALARLHAEGFTELYWFKGGVHSQAKEKLVFEVDLEPNGVDSIGLKDVLKKFKTGKTVFVDVRAKKVKGIYNAVEIPYKSKDVINYFPESKAPIEIEDLRKSGDSFNLSIFKGLNKSQEIIIYGRDKNDWMPLRAAIWLKSEGFKKVSVYKAGALEWHNKFYSYKDPSKNKKYFNGKKRLKLSKYKRSKS